MTTLQQRLRADLAAAGLAPLHRLGQNFMINDASLECLVSELGAHDGMRVVEIGPGTGHLTEKLLQSGCDVLAIELDRGLHGFLTTRFGSDARYQSRLSLVHGDCLVDKNHLHPALLEYAEKPWCLSANLPYDVALPVLLNAVALPRPPERVVVTIQYEAAQRLCALPGQDAWGASAAVIQAAGTPRLVRRLPPACFFPQPRVDSAIISWTPRLPMPAGFGRWCRAVFSARRKVLPGALRDAGHVRSVGEDACRRCGLDLTRRLEDLSAAELLALFAALGGNSKEESHDHPSLV